MNAAKAAFGIVGLLALLVGIRIAIALANPPDDRKLVVEALAASIEASREGRPGGVMDKISEKFTVNDQVPGSRRQIAQFVRDSKPDVEVLSQEPLVTGSEARIVSPVKVSMTWMGTPVSHTLENVTLIFRKEDDREWLVIPTRKWKLAEVEVPEMSIDDFVR